MSEGEGAGAPDASAAAETFVGYHGTSSVYVPGIAEGIKPVSGRNFLGRAQLGEGFYVTPDDGMAHYFAVIAVRQVGGTPVALRIYARSFERMTKEIVPRDLWWEVAADSPYISDFDYLIAPIDGFETSPQLKFNPRAYHALIARSTDE